MRILNISKIVAICAAVVSSSALALLLGSCREPTEIRLHVSTNVPCTDASTWKGVAVYVGSPGADVETKAPALTTTSCDVNGQVGSLVVVPSGSKDAEVGLKIVAGLAVPPEGCAAHNYQGCIVARRALRFTAHDRVDLDIPLTNDCVNVSCDDTHTCVAASCTDSETATAATTDTTEPTVRCGDNGIRCPTTGNVCCFTADPSGLTGTGECKPADQCPSTSTILNCDDSIDCPVLADGGVNVCAISFMTKEPGVSAAHVPKTVASAACTTRADQTLELCQDRRGCFSTNQLCHESVGDPSNPLPGYFWCENN